MKKCSECACLSIGYLGLRFADCRAPENIDKGAMKALKFVGIDDPPNEYRLDYVSIQRAAGWFWARLDNRCGREGRWFKLKEIVE